jgi:tRNA 2-thiouridine synthesizing protein A
MVKVDARGLGCPIPVVKTKKAIEASPDEEIAVLVETAVAKENISRLARSRNYSIEVEEVAGDEYRLLLTPAEKWRGAGKREGHGSRSF